VYQQCRLLLLYDAPQTSNGMQSDNTVQY